MRNIKFYTLPAILFCLLAVFTSCDNLFDFETESVSFILPEWESDYPSLSRWIISVRSAQIRQDYYLDSGSEKITMTVSRNEPLCICASPVTLLSDNSETQFFKMAGGLYPYSGDTASVTWEGGFTSYIMKKIIDSADENQISKEELKSFLLEFNWKKMNEKISENIYDSLSGKFYNPWQIDEETLLLNLSNAGFDSDFLNTKYVYTISEEVLQNCGITVTLEEDFLSSFIPQNKIIKENGTISLKKNQIETFMISNTSALNLTATSAKKVSASVTYMPIIVDEYEYP